MVKNDTTYKLSAFELEKFIEKQRACPTINAFDFKKAADIIKKENIKNARWGLDGDWKNTSDYCVKNGKAVTEHDSYLNSTYAIPTLVDVDTGKEYPCFTVENKDDWETRNDWSSEEIDLINAVGFQSKLI